MSIEIPYTYQVFDNKSGSNSEKERYLRMLRLKNFHKLVQELYPYDECVIDGIRIICAFNRAEEDDVRITFLDMKNSKRYIIILQVMGFGDIRVLDRIRNQQHQLIAPEPEYIAMMMHDFIQFIRKVV